jgi:hypothetical protein
VAFVTCRRCGEFRIDDLALLHRDEIYSKDKEARHKVSYSIRKITSHDPNYLLTVESLTALVSQTSLPTPPEQLENLIYSLGESNLDAGEGVALDDKYMAIVGAKSVNNLKFIAESAKNDGLIDGHIHSFIGGGSAITDIKLTIRGWAAYLDLKKGKTETKQAFMAMKFGDGILDNIYQTHFKPAVAGTGFGLKRLDEGQRAGLIDDNLRVEIRKSKFLIADLTHHNNGAYWEAGFAEGLGKPVIYTCRKDVFDDKQNTTHFDTNHHLTVLWEDDKLEEAVRNLKATIRATLPEDAKMEDTPVAEAE